MAAALSSGAQTSAKYPYCRRTRQWDEGGSRAQQEWVVSPIRFGEQTPPLKVQTSVMNMWGALGTAINELGSILQPADEPPDLDWLRPCSGEPSLARADSPGRPRECGTPALLPDHGRNVSLSVWRFASRAASCDAAKQRRVSPRQTGALPHASHHIGAGSTPLRRNSGHKPNYENQITHPSPYLTCIVQPQSNPCIVT